MRFPRGDVLFFKIKATLPTCCQWGAGMGAGGKSATSVLRCPVSIFNDVRAYIHFVAS